ncbi:hypothetical protein ACJMK2_024525 [Sinanodonta woodiana]|uniref:Phosphatidylethanolamine N-methyltransferase n=2 Tax=Sinanodonta woodiana TaxID=1069815 RepID=A0ABD3XHG6_SINWO
MLPRELRGCCNENYLLDFSKIEIPAMDVIWSDLNLWIAAANIAFNPLFWNMVARWEYRTKKLSQMFGSAKAACTVLAVTIIVLGVIRDYRYNEALNSQPRWKVLHQNWILWLGYLNITVGIVLVFCSFLALGFFGTFLGDYFGMLLDEKVTGFPFNLMDNPMYWGSTLNFLGTALVKASPAGILLTCFVAVCYKIAIFFECPFTKKIYQERDEKKKVI